jgi:hypothetical protein
LWPAGRELTRPVIVLKTCIMCFILNTL